jgi:PAS domain S-box-containing protein
MSKRLQPVLDIALDAVVVMQRDGVVVAWNRVAEAAFGWAAAEAIGRPMAELIVPPQHREGHNQGLRRYNATGVERVLNQRLEITAIDKAGREFPVELSITTAPAEDDIVFIGFLRDISLRKEADARLARQVREARLLFDVTSLAANTSSFEEALEACLKAICELTGWPVGHALLLKGGALPTLQSASVWHEVEPGSSAELKGATSRLSFVRGEGLPGMILETGEPAWISNAETDPNFVRKGLGFGAAFAFPIKSEGRIVAVLEFFSRNQAQPDADLMLTVRTLGEQVGRVLERKETEKHQRLLINELNHRVKNTLAIVQSVASQTFKGDAVIAAQRSAFERRLAALAGAHDVLTAENWSSASLSDIVKKTGVGCGADDTRVHVDGPEVRVPPRTAVSLGMALHELCTNAVKYGALSGECGNVYVTWRLGEGSVLRLDWKEEGGPVVHAPSRRGFGSKMIERALASELNGQVELRFLSEGVHCTVEAPLPHDD